MSGKQTGMGRLAYDRKEERLYLNDGDVNPTVAWMDDNAAPEVNAEYADKIVSRFNAPAAPASPAPANADAEWMKKAAAEIFEHVRENTGGSALSWYGAIRETFATIIAKHAPANAELIGAAQRVVEANSEFRQALPAGWEGDPVNDACEALAAALTNARGGGK